MSQGETPSHHGSTGLALTSREWLTSHFLAKANTRSKHVSDLPIYPGDQVLDVACGPGIYTEKFAELCSPGGHVTGIDKDPVLLDYAENLCKRSIYHENISFDKVDITRERPTGGNFDVIVFFNCLSYISSPAQIVSEYRSLLNPRGRILMKDSDFGHFLIEPNHDLNVQVIIDRARKGNELQKGQFDNFYGRQLCSLTEDAGLTQTRPRVWSYPMKGPLSRHEIEYISGNMLYLADQAEEYLADEITQAWRSVFDIKSNNFLHRDDIFFLMHEILTVSEIT
jgi:ubiquinone/menaquinone biosynthesis C-methylase UbiE